MRCTLSLALALVLTTAAPAAPLPAGTSVGEKYLLDDADFIAVVRLKQVLASPLYKKNHDKLIGDVLKTEPVAGLLKEAGLDPLKDIDRIVMIIGHSCFETDAKLGGGGPVFLVQGRFDLVKILAAADKLAKDMPGAKVTAHGDTKILELSSASLFAAVLDKGHLFLAADRAHVEAALDKAAGKKKTSLKNKPFAELFAKMKCKSPVEVLATATMVIYVTGGVDPAGKFELKKYTLGEAGVLSYQGAVEIKDKIKVRATLAVKDEDTARTLATMMGEGLKDGTRLIAREASKLAEALGAVKFTARDKEITIVGQGGADVVTEMFKGMFGVRVDVVPNTEFKPLGKKRT
jgi:hypothetical protein